MFLRSLGVVVLALMLSGCALWRDPPPEPRCLSLLKIAATEWVNESFPPEYSRVGYVPEDGYNDVLCDNEMLGIDESMMNAAILAINTKTGENSYGIFHIHAMLSEKRILVGRPTNLVLGRTDDWAPLKGDDGWRHDWCEAIRTVYPEDHERLCE